MCGAATRECPVMDETPDAVYERLIAQLKRTYSLGRVSGLLGWDQQVNLPSGGAAARTRDIGLVAELLHREGTKPEIEDWLSALEAAGDSLDEDRRTVVRWARRSYDRRTKLPPEFVTEFTELVSRAYHVWADARKADDFARYAPVLEKVLDFSRREAAMLGYEKNPYDYHIDVHDPGLTEADIVPLFDRLRRPLRDAIETILASPVKADLSVFKGFPVERQREFVLQVAERIGFDRNRGRLDVSLHPFCGGDGDDIRMTTRFDPDNPLDAIFSTIHETGHALYSQGLPRDHFGTALGQAAGMAVHESQSRLWENQVGRGPAFWQFFEPRLREAFGDRLKDVSSDDLYLAINQVRLNPIRVDSDEVTYNLHILLRFEIEKGLFDGSLAVRDLPGEWNRLAGEIIGLHPENDAEGVLQDIHWAYGSFGYFPSYCLGNMMAAQLWKTVREKEPGLEEDFARGDFSRLLTWLRENIHSQGKRHETGALVERVTGEPLAPDALLEYLRERYLPLYA